MRMIRGHKNDVSGFNAERFAINGDLHFAFKHLDQSIERCGVLAQCLLFIEGEQGYRAGFTTDKNSAYN